MGLPKTGDLILGKYLLEKLIGEGGMGVVYAARHDLLGQRVAVKLIRPESALRADGVTRFLNEARAAARIENEHVARVLDVGMLENGLPYMVLEYLDGSDLARILDSRGPLPVAEVADYLLQTIEAVAHAHAFGIVHRDLKPSNLFLARRQDGTARVKVLDFGISKVVGPVQDPSANMTKTNAMLGSPLYMSPEQLRDSKSVDHRCDIWALGVVAYELLTGRVPFNADNAVALFAAIQESEPASLCSSRAEIGAQLDAIVLKCLRRRPDERFSSVTELAASLAPFGTVTGAIAFENAKRILPLQSAPAPLRGSTPPSASSSAPRWSPDATPASLPSASSQPAGAVVRTADPWSTSRSVPGKRRSSVPVVVGSLALVAAVVASAGWLGAKRIWAPHRTAEAAASAPVSTSASIPNMLDAPTPTLAPTVDPIPTPALSSLAPETPGLTDAASPIAPGLRRDVATATSVRPKVAALPSAVASSRPNCTTPFEIDAKGNKVWKRECF